MDPDGAPEAELLSTRRWISSSAGGSFWPLNNDDERSSDPAPPDEQQDSSDSGSEREEDMNHNAGQNARAPSARVQRLHWTEQQQHGDAAPSPAHCHARCAAPCTYPPAAHHPFSDPYAFPAFPSAYLHVFPFVYPYTFPFIHPYACPLAYPHTLPRAAPAFHSASPPPVDPGPSPQLIARYRLARPEEDDDDFDLDVAEIEFVGDVIGAGPVENIQPFSPENSFEEFSFSHCDSSAAEDAESPSASGLRSSTRRRREESDGEEAAAKRPRWSDESQSD